MKPNTAKAAEMKIIIWFLQEGWELYTPVSDLYGTDIVVRHPVTREFIAIQIKHKQPGSLNEGKLINYWTKTAPLFDYLIFWVPEKNRGLIIPSSKLNKRGKMFMFYTEDSNGYSRGPVRRLYQNYAFELNDYPLDEHAKRFINFFKKSHALFIEGIKSSNARS